MDSKTKMLSQNEVFKASGWEFKEKKQTKARGLDPWKHNHPLRSDWRYPPTFLRHIQTATIMNKQCHFSTQSKRKSEPQHSDFLQERTELDKGAGAAIRAFAAKWASQDRIPVATQTPAVGIWALGY